ncbi:MAG: hypothetical protein P4N60_18515 [Verrucomicrobiae bacterium]|nr:hypothetical protein [Verrucomicrobiae bacterium]
MKDQLIQILGLKPAAGAAECTDAEIVAAVAELKRRDDASAATAAKERAITDLVNQSLGALSRDSAREIVEERTRTEAWKRGK